MKRQFSDGRAIAAPTVAGTWMNGWRSSPPASSRQTELLRILRQSGREHAAGGAGANDDEVECVGHHTAAETAMSDRRCQRSMFTSEFMTPVARPTKVMSSSGSTQKIVVPAPCWPNVSGEVSVPKSA